MPNIDLQGTQRVRIEWRMETPQDDCDDCPADRQDGFWPSRDPKEAGYVGEVTDDEFAAMWKSAAQRMAAWKAGDWHYVGIVAVAVIYVPIGGDSYVIHTMRSAGCWGVESDCEEYHKEVYEDEKSALLDAIKTMGAAVTSGDLLASEGRFR